jgi:hypothetical protein
MPLNSAALLAKGLGVAGALFGYTAWITGNPDSDRNGTNRDSILNYNWFKRPTLGLSTYASRHTAAHSSQFQSEISVSQTKTRNNNASILRNSICVIKTILRTTG